MAYSGIYIQKKSIFIKETINEKKKKLVAPQKVSFGCWNVKFSQALWSSHFYDKEAKDTDG